MDYTKLKAKGKEYDSGEISTVSASNFDAVRKWNGKSVFAPYGSREFELRMLLHDDNRERLRSIFGRASFCWRSEFSYSCWLLDLSGTQVLIMSAKDKGTCYEVVDERNGVKVEIDVNVVVDFLKWITNELDKRKEMVSG